ncbi:class I SAM-dependent methyltransferase [Thermaerobacter sp. PB12/4term]|uniref:class I SAM-dependent methyltransferase n=1 Tax=Thermaerobacter sp. PB12/4term TaxID=2293838 RepID=UPI001FAD1C39|nr:SAM-dependent methyltransferase [Thermaerobacter sp. PB12/4term]
MQVQGNPALIRLLMDEIRRQGAIPFARYMDLALHHPQHGYYAQARPLIGREGDFLTAPSFHPAFGRTIWRQVREMLHILGFSPRRGLPARPARILEIGAGGGHLARDLLLAARSDGYGPGHLEYVIVDESRPLQERQRDLITAAWPEAPVRWVPRVEQAGPVHVVLMNELMSAFPVHRLVRRPAGQVAPAASSPADTVLPAGRQAAAGATGGPAASSGGNGGANGSSPFGPGAGSDQAPGRWGPERSGDHRQPFEWRELYVTVQGGRFVQVEGPVSEPRAVAILREEGIEPQPGQIVDVNVGAGDMLRAIAGVLARRAFVITIDYGGPAEVVYNPQRPRGTVRGYYRQRLLDDPFARPGEQDITADLDFTYLQRLGRRLGLRDLGLLPQGAFLLNLGIEEKEALPLARRAWQGDLEADQALQRVYALYAPEGLGESFWVLVQARGFRWRAPRLQGVRVPWPEPKPLAELLALARDQQ